MGGNISAFTKVRTTFVLGSGGHTAELLGLVGASCSNCELVSLPFMLLMSGMNFFGISCRHLDWNTGALWYLFPCQIRTLDPLVYNPRTYYLADTDKLSEQKAKVVFAHSMHKIWAVFFVLRFWRRTLGPVNTRWWGCPGLERLTFLHIYTLSLCMGQHWFFCLIYTVGPLRSGIPDLVRIRT